jgi:hypothetical protein
MAVLTLGTQHSSVEYRIFVASQTLGRKPGKLTICMAILATHVNMSTGQREVAQVVVKCSLFPIEGSMAGSAVRAKATIVLIILLMAGITIRGRALKNTILMARLAADFGVFPLQLESGEIMVKRSPFPIIWSVADTAICAETTLVGII